MLLDRRRLQRLHEFVNTGSARSNATTLDRFDIDRPGEERLGGGPFKAFIRIRHRKKPIRQTPLCGRVPSADNLFMHAAMLQMDAQPLSCPQVSQASVRCGQITVLNVGPAVHLVGGMSTVVGQLLSLDLGERFRVAHFPTTMRCMEGESSLGRIRRHVSQSSRLREAIQADRTSIVHLHTCSGFSFHRSVVDLLAARHCGCRTVLHIHGAAFDVFFEQSNPVVRTWIGWGLEQADRVIALSAAWADELERMSPRAKITVIENAVALPPERSMLREPGPLRLLFLARLDDWKGVDDLLDAIAMLHRDGVDLELTLAGPAGSAGDECSLPDKLQIRGIQSVVRWPGAVNGREKSNLLERSDLFVQPSWNEGMPIALLEAMAYGLPVVATSVGAVPEVIRDGDNGLLVPSHQPRALADAILILCLQPERRAALSGAARGTIEARFSLSRLKNDLTALYASLQVEG